MTKPLCIKTINERQSTNLDLKVEVLDQSEYINQFNFIGDVRLPDENKSLLKNHIYNLYNELV